MILLCSGRLRNVNLCSRHIIALIATSVSDAILTFSETREAVEVKIRMTEKMYSYMYMCMNLLLRNAQKQNICLNGELRKLH